MTELRYVILGELLVSTLMALGAACLFAWAAASGLFQDLEAVKHEVLDREGVGRDGGA